MKKQKMKICFIFVEKTRKGSASKTHASQRMNPVTKDKLKEEKKEKHKERRSSRESKSSHDTEQHRSLIVGADLGAPSNGNLLIH
jgi:hypothetical protein